MMVTLATLRLWSSRPCFWSHLLASVVSRFCFRGVVLLVLVLLDATLLAPCTRLEAKELAVRRLRSSRGVGSFQRGLM